MIKGFYIIFIFGFCSSVFAKTINYKNADTGIVEIITRPAKDSLSRDTSLVKVEFYRANMKNEQLGLMVVGIDSLKYLTKEKGGFEKKLKTGKSYRFEFKGTGYYLQKKTIKIESGLEYLIKVYVEINPAEFIFIDKPVERSEE